MSTSRATRATFATRHFMMQNSSRDTSSVCMKPLKMSDVLDFYSGNLSNHSKPFYSKSYRNYNSDFLVY